MRMNTSIAYRLGIDVGSTTVKAVMLDDGDKPVFQDYRRHNADVRAELAKLLADISFEFPGARVRASITGSGGLSVANALSVSFVQEVIAETEATRRNHPEVDVIIELGGEDAKLTYLHPTPEQRMNGTCAGGTGAFIDQMATLLKTDASGLNTLAAGYQQLYPIASRCGVFAKSDVQPLINQGAAHEDLAASIFQAVATQTVAGLACGRPIRGNVMFLGGPLHFLPELRNAYDRILDKVDTYITPDNAQLYVALGAALLAEKADIAILADLVAKLEATKHLGAESHRMRPLFADEQERAEFNERHAQEAISFKDTDKATGDCFLGIDAGSTTIKAVLIDGDDDIVFTHYASNEGDPVAAAIDIVKHIHAELPPTARIVRSCSTGYGEGLVKTALGVDEGEIETMAHYRAAEHIRPGVTSVIDIGGQDMKYLRIRSGVVDSISVNEACSSGCGSFLQTFAETMGIDVRSFAAAAVQAQSPVDLGTRCTVFMNSSVKQAQKEGADVGDISAGLSYSVVRNALYKVIKLKDPEDLGESVVVQGGTFLNDAVLRAFELLTGRHVVRPNIAGLMGAYGAALTAKMHYDPATADPEKPCGLLSPEELEGLTVTTERKTCRLCQNHCQMTISTFSTGERHVSGNRCERGASLERVPKKSPIPNMFDWKYKRVFGYRRLTEDKATRGDIGIPRVLNMYEDYPFWFTVLTQLKFRVLISGRSNHDLFEEGMESIPSENVCYPAKLVHGHIESLLKKGVQTIFYPCVSYEQETANGQDNSFNCPIVATYPEVIRNNMESLAGPDIRFISPFLSLRNREVLPRRIAEVFAEWGVTEEEAAVACAKGWEELDAFHAEVRAKGQEALQYIREHNMRGIVLAGRPYHLDPEINHGIPEVIIGLGMAVLTEDAMVEGALERPLRVRDQWAYHSRLYEAAATVGDDVDLELVQLTSFGCGLDAITADQVIEILEGRGDVYTGLKIDEVSNLGAARIRLRSLAAAVEERHDRAESMTVDTAGSGDDVPLGKRGEAEYATAGHIHQRVAFTKKMREDGYTVLCPQMSPIHFRLIAETLRAGGYNVKLLEKASRDDIEVGLKYVNNDACYPAIVVIGQLISAILRGEVDPDRTAVAITQTGGMCRATNYAGLLRKGLRDAGYEQIPVIAISAQGIEENPGFSMTPTLIHNAVKAITLGDVLQKVLLRTRPYQIEGNATALYEKWDAVCREYFAEGGYSRTLGRRIGFHALIKSIVREFDVLPLQDIPRKPRVGMVGEILVQFHPDANNHAVEVIEREGCEAELPSLAQFFHNSLVTADWKYQVLGEGSNRGRYGKKLALWAMQQYEKPARRALALSERFEAGATIQQLATKAQEIVQLGNQAGEGWYLTADMMDMIESCCPNIICAQPFACLPNHVVGKGMFRALRSKYPQANIVAIDYDPGASEVNQLNRIKLMISTAFLQHEAGLEDTDAEFDPTENAGGGCGSCPISGLAGDSVPNRASGKVLLGMPMMRR
ncbi:acyl-CoA dehydratase activase-related protein [Actinobaculum sp. 313]|uniref:acyl-CoA dehydratase activase-related protein n=1 Tax=Actinobaculum sp. 313 TaxID=2495645 RepID=UPI000D525D8B|nr:acyl-CoA dehydratase activase-related protein [Actinobaculum sp. 313]AWE42061.1 activase [Actinobaculum sp. 313]